MPFVVLLEMLREKELEIKLPLLVCDTNLCRVGARRGMLTRYQAGSVSEPEYAVMSLIF